MRPQVIHVARPVLVDRPVPVTQRPIIIDRERPIPVPVRGANQTSGQCTDYGTIREEYVYRDNLPVAYGGRCPENAVGISYGYMPTQQDHQYAVSSTYDMSNNYQTQEAVINEIVPEQFQHSQSTSHINVQQNCGRFDESYDNLARASSASVVGVNSFIDTAPIEVFDPAVSSTWQKTDKVTLTNHYGRSAYDIVTQSDQIEQQMYRELRQQSSGAGIQRSYSGASYKSGSGVAANSGGGFPASSESFSSIPHGNIQNFNIESATHYTSEPTPVCVNY